MDVDYLLLGCRQQIVAQDAGVQNISICQNDVGNAEQADRRLRHAVNPSSFSRAKNR